MGKLSRPIDKDTSYYQPKIMEPGYYRSLINGFSEWGSNRDLNISGLLDKMPRELEEKVTVVSIVWDVKIVEPPYDGYSRSMWTTYWASPEKLQDVYQNKVNKYLEKNPGASEEDIKDNVHPWRPQEATFEVLFACNLMAKDEDSGIYVPIGWELTEDGFTEALQAAINTTVWGKYGKQGDRQDALLKLIPMDER